MIASNIGHETLLFAAHRTGVRAEITPLSSPRDRAPRRFRVKLYLDTAGLYTPSGRRRRRSGSPIPAHYQRTSPRHSSRLVSAVCWHGFRDFFRNCYALEPTARFRTAFATWLGLEHFENNHRESYYRNAGSQRYPIYYGECCTCQEVC